MGEVIRKTAAAADIVADARAAHSKSMARPGTPFAEAAEAHVAPVLRLIDEVDAQLTAAVAEEAPLLNALEVADEGADAVLGKRADTIWNAIGRPRTDPAYSLLFPGGVGGYADGDVLEQPTRMEVLVKLLRSGVHPKLPADVAEEAASEIEASAAALRDAAEAIRGPRTRVRLLEATMTALARSAAIELSRMKRSLLVEGLTQAQIHEVIPDRSRPKPKTPAPAPAQA